MLVLWQINLNKLVEATANKDITQEVMICNGQRDKSENLFVTWLGSFSHFFSQNERPEKRTLLALVFFLGM